MWAGTAHRVTSKLLVGTAARYCPQCAPKIGLAGHWGGNHGKYSLDGRQAIGKWKGPAIALYDTTGFREQQICFRWPPFSSIYSKGNILSVLFCGNCVVVRVGGYTHVLAPMDTLTTAKKGNVDQPSYSQNEQWCNTKKSWISCSLTSMSLRLWHFLLIMLSKTRI